MTPHQWLVAPCDMGPSWPGLGDAIDLWRFKCEMERARAAQRKWDDIKNRLYGMSNRVTTDGRRLTMDDIWRTFKPL